MAEPTYLSQSGVYILMKIAGVQVVSGELNFFKASYSYWTQAPVLEFILKSNRPELINAAKATGATVYLEYGPTDENYIPLDRKITRWAVIDHDATEAPTQTSQMAKITVYCTVDALKYFNMAQIDGSTSELTVVQAMKKLPCFGSGKEGSDTLYLQIDDDLESRGGDKQKWLQLESTCIEYLNTLLKHSLIKDNPNGGKEWIYFPVINFDKKGTPTFRLTDLKLRCQYLDPVTIVFPDGSKKPAKFSHTYSQEYDRISYHQCEPEVRGVGYYSQFWKKATLSINQHHSTTTYQEVQELMLFPDSISIEDEQGALFDKTPKQALFKGSGRTNIHYHNSNDYGSQFGPQRYQVAACLGFLRRVNLRTSLPGSCIFIEPGDIVNMEVSEPSLGNIELRTRNNNLSTNYCVTELYHTYNEGTLSTYFVSSRDSLSKDGTK